MGKPRFSFPMVYFGTLAFFLLLDVTHIMHPSMSIAKLKMMDTGTFLIWDLVGAEYSNLWFIAYGVLLMPVLHLWRTLVKYCASVVALHGAGLKASDTNKAMNDKFEKFCESFWLFVHYTCVCVLELTVLSTMDWFPGIRPFYHNDAAHILMGQHLEEQQNPGFQAIYLVQFSFYFLELTTLLVNWNKPNKEKYVMLFHHLYTVYLMGISWLRYHHRIGVLVLVLHDVGDVFLPIGKCFSYAEDHVRAKYSKWVFWVVEKLGLMFFVLFIISFVVPRVLGFGALVRSAVYETELFACVLNHQDPYSPRCIPGITYPGMFWSQWLLIVLVLLYPMHIWWTYLIYNMAVNVVFGKYDDVRSGDEGDKPTKRHED